MSENELLRLSAKAIGFELEYRRGSDAFYYDDPDSGREQWDPLSDDGQALRLAIKLGICIVFMEECDSVVAEHSAHGAMIVEAMDDYGTRRAIVRVAAEIGSRP
ncbi:hypothetical protein SRABI89_05050 [Pseudomonas koreensis]|nr:hypothetical protein SRABI89_05050 [Pseudomonas koreensis]